MSDRPLRVLMVTEDIPAAQVGGLGKHVVSLGNSLVRAGHAVVLLGRAGVALQPHEDDLGFEGRLVTDFQFAGLSWGESRIGAWLPFKRRAMARRVEHAILAHAADVDVVHYHGHLPMVGAGLPKDLNFVQTRHDQGSECLIHLRFRDGAPCTQTAPAACAGCIHRNPGVARRSLSAWAVRQYRADVAANFARRKTVFVSEFLRRQFLRAVPQADLRLSRVIHNFIDLRRLRQVDASLAVTPGSLLMAGRMDDAKGFGAFLQAFVPMLSAGQVLQLVGDGPERAALQARYGGPQVAFLGWRSNAEVLALTRSAQVCVVPSVWEEPCGTTVLEALLLGRPTLALARGGTPELAAYARYPGQLQLAPDMAGLARAAAAALAAGWPVLPLPDSNPADVDAALPAMLACYRAPSVATAHPVPTS